MRKALSLVFGLSLLAPCMVGQTGQARMSPTSVTAGKNITITITESFGFDSKAFSKAW